MDAALQFVQVDKEFEPTIADLFKQACSLVEIDLREVVLLDSQSTMDIFCNASLVRKTYKSTTSMRLKSKSANMVVTRKATMPGCKKDVWFSTRSITNIIALRNLIQQYHVTYDSDDKMFVVQQESQGKPNMLFRIHKCGLHYYDPRNKKHIAFINTGSENKEDFTKSRIKVAEVARTLYKTLSYPSMKYFKWIIRSNQIKDFPVTVQNIDVDLKIWGKNIAALKDKTTRSKTIPVARDYVKVPFDIMKLHKEVFLTTDILFVNNNPFFLALSREITSQPSITLWTAQCRKYARLSRRVISIISNVVFTSQWCTPTANSRP
jgi:hypothetical protein